jgi:PAS domain S-box-containing protein
MDLGRETAKQADADRDLAAARMRYEGILAIAEDAIVSVDADQMIIFFNRGAEKTFGYTASEVLGQPLEMLMPARFAQAHRKHVIEFGASTAISRRMGERSEVLGKRKDGSEFPAESSISRLSVNGEIIYTAAMRDITERKLAEEAIHQINQSLEQRVLERTAQLAESNQKLAQKTEEAQAMAQQLWHAAKLASVGELAASIAHELNNPMATVSLRVESVLDKTPADDPRRRSLEIAQQEIQRMGNLVANLLQFSRREGDQASSVHLPDELAKSLELVQHLFRRGRVQVVREVAADVPTIIADRQKLRQVFLNLLTNASDAMPNGGTLTLRVERVSLPKGQPGVAIEFADTGVGIAKENLAKVMDPFFTTKEEGKGTGLGLAICRRVLQEHHGTLEIVSEPGKGARIRLALPVLQDTNVAYLRKGVTSKD